MESILRILLNKMNFVGLQLYCLLQSIQIIYFKTNLIKYISNFYIGNLYKKTYKITDCVALDVSSEKSGENGEPPEMDNPVGSNGSE